MVDLSTLYRVSNAKSRSISPENLTGEPGRGGMCPLEEGSARRAARDLGLGWKVNPYLVIPAEIHAGNRQHRRPRNHQPHLADSHRPLAQHHHPLLLGRAGKSVRGMPHRRLLLHAAGTNTRRSTRWPCASIPAAPSTATGRCPSAGTAASRWKTAPRSRRRFTIRSTTPSTSFRRKSPTSTPSSAASIPCPTKQVYTILDGVEGKGQYVGTYMAWGTNNNTLVGRGRDQVLHGRRRRLPDHLRNRHGGLLLRLLRLRGSSDSRPLRALLHALYRVLQVVEPNRLYRSQFRFGLYRWHITDPIHFEQNLRVTIQALGWREGGRYLPLQDDHRLCGLLVSDAPRRQVPAAPGQGFAGNHLIFRRPALLRVGFLRKNAGRPLTFGTFCRII